MMKYFYASANMIPGQHWSYTGINSYLALYGNFKGDFS